MARFPRLVDAAILRAAASPRETQCMRVEIRGVPSNVPYRLAGKGTQRYLLDHHPASHAHILDVPVSVWMDNREELARDIMGGPHSSRLVVLCVPWGGKAEEPVVEETEQAIDDSDDYLTPEQKALQALEDSETEPPDP